MPHDGWAAAPLAAVGGFRPWKMDPTLALLGCPRPIAIGNPIHLSLYLGLHLHLALPHQATGADALGTREIWRRVLIRPLRDIPI
jgi:hypothetical protein